MHVIDALAAVTAGIRQSFGTFVPPTVFNIAMDLLPEIAASLVTAAKLDAELSPVESEYTRYCDRLTPELLIRDAANRRIDDITARRNIRDAIFKHIQTNPTMAAAILLQSNRAVVEFFAVLDRHEATTSDGPATTESDSATPKRLGIILFGSPTPEPPPPPYKSPPTDLNQRAIELPSEDEAQ